MSTEMSTRSDLGGEQVTESGREAIAGIVRVPSAVEKLRIHL
jgi:hypothetical protein